MLRQLLHLYLPYRSFADPIFALGAIVVPCWLLYRVYRHRARGHALSFRREILLLAFVVYLSGLAAVTLIPSGNPRLRSEDAAAMELLSVAALTCSSATLPRGSTERSFCVRNARGNVMLFFPLGVLIPLVWRRRRFWSGVGIAIALSIAIELAQFVSSAWGSHRSPDMNDVVLNVLGACLGLLLMSLLRLRPSTPHKA